MGGQGRPGPPDPQPTDAFFRRLNIGTAIAAVSGGGVRASSGAFRSHPVLPAEAIPARISEVQPGRRTFEVSVNWGQLTDLCAEVRRCGTQYALGYVMFSDLSDVGAVVESYEELENPAHCRLFVTDKMAERLAKVCRVVHTPPSVEPLCVCECCVERVLV